MTFAKRGRATMTAFLILTAAASNLAVAAAKPAATAQAAGAVDPFATAQSLYLSGHYDEAVAAAKPLGTAEAHALAASALNAKAISRTPYDQRLPILRQALAEADTAIAKDAKCFDGYMEKLIAYGELQRMNADLGSAMKGAASTSRKLIDQALALQPEDPDALTALGSWHLEIVRRAPVGLGKMIFGASRKDGVAAFEKAVAAGPDSVFAHFEYAMALLSQDAQRNRAKAETLLKTAAGLTSDDAFAQFMQKRAHKLLALLAQGDRQKLDTLLAAYRGETAEPG